MSFDGFMRVAKSRLRENVAVCQRLFRKVPEIESGPGMGMRFDAGPGRNRFVTGEYERPVQETITSLAQAGDVFYDIGANLGFFSVLLGRLVGTTGVVYAFEPVPANASMVRRNARLNGLKNIQVVRIAVSRDTGRSELLLAHHVGGAVLKDAGVPPDLAGSLMVETASIDTLVERQQIRPPNVVKIDVEGAELEVLQGMESVLRDWSPVVLLEVDDADGTRCNHKLAECRQFLGNLGYRCEVLPNSYKDSVWFVRHLIARRETCANSKSAQSV